MSSISRKRALDRINSNLNSFDAEQVLVTGERRSIGTINSTHTDMPKKSPQTMNKSKHRFDSEDITADDISAQLGKNKFIRGNFESILPQLARIREATKKGYMSPLKRTIESQTLRAKPFKVRPDPNMQPEFSRRASLHSFTPDKHLRKYPDRSAFTKRKGSVGPLPVFATAFREEMRQKSVSAM